MCNKTLILQQFLNPGTFLLFFKVTDFLIIVDLNQMKGTIEKTDEKRRLTEERL